MAKIRLSKPPRLPQVNSHRDYLPWLLENIYYRVCSYCLTYCRKLDVDHYEPEKYKPARIKDPKNLLTGCNSCNGRGGKSDYHPKHKKRTRLPSDRSGHLVLDPRVDDSSKMFSIDKSSGEIGIIAPQKKVRSRADFNIRLLKLDRGGLNEYRKELQEMLDAAERLLKQRQVDLVVLKPIASYISKNATYFKVFDIPFSAKLKKYLKTLPKVVDW